MAFFKWSDDLSVDVPEMDEQHKKLVSMIDELHNAMKDRHGSDIVGKIINDMVNYTAIHFSSEEKLMKDGTKRGKFSWVLRIWNENY